MRNVFLLAQLLLLGTQQLCHGWLDEGHMLVMQVAINTMGPTNTEKYNKTLQYWINEFPDMSDLITASVWADHLSCRPDSCEGAEHSNIFYFAGWHYENIPFNPEHIQLKPVNTLQPYTNTGAVWAISKGLFSMGEPFGPKTAISSSSVAEPSAAELRTDDEDKEEVGSLVAVKEDEDEDMNWPMSSETAGEELGLFRRTDLSNPIRGYAGGSQTIGTLFSWNLNLRLLIHIYADLHNPLHACELFSREYPDGDRGGNDIKVVLPEEFAGVGDNLHMLWDNAAGLYSKRYSDVKADELAAEAKALMDKYPTSFFGTRFQKTLNGLHIQAISFDTNRLARQNAYINSWGRESLKPFHPSVEYLKNLQEIVRQQLVLAGYRLAKVLNAIIHSMPVAA